MVRPSSPGAKPRNLQTNAGRSYLEAAQRQGSLPVVIPGRITKTRLTQGSKRSNKGGQHRPLKKTGWSFYSGR